MQRLLSSRGDAQRLKPDGPQNAGCKKPRLDLRGAADWMRDRPIREGGAQHYLGHELVFFNLQAGYCVFTMRLLTDVYDAEHGTSLTTSRDERELDCARPHGSQEERDA